jgi:hypothetical protein
MKNAIFFLVSQPLRPIRENRNLLRTVMCHRPCKLNEMVQYLKAARYIDTTDCLVTTLQSWDLALNNTASSHLLFPSVSQDLQPTGPQSLFPACEQSLFPILVVPHQTLRCHKPRLAIITINSYCFPLFHTPSFVLEHLFPNTRFVLVYTLLTVDRMLALSC